MEKTLTFNLDGIAAVFKNKNPAELNWTVVALLSKTNKKLLIK